MKELLGKYIEFAMKNGFKIKGATTFTMYSRCDDFSIDFGRKGNSYTSVITFHKTELITSKEFIDAVARGIEGKYIDNMVGPTGSDRNRLYKTIQDITKDQAIAIRDKKLKEFIEKIIN